MSGDFLDRYAAALEVAGVGAAGEALTAAEEEMVLELARVVAHGTERRNAPLATYLTGLVVAGQPGHSAREAALQRILEIARSTAGEGAGTS